MSVNADGVFTKFYSDLRIDVIRCKQGQRSTDDLDVWIEDVSVKIRERHHEIIGLILEPLVQGAGGMIVWPVEAVDRICTLCREYGVLLIFDEVMTGLGRTGKLFAFEHLQELPDFVCLSKGLTGGLLPLALTLTSSEIYQTFLSEDVAKMFFHGHSFTANAITCAAACANLKLFKKNSVLEKITVLEKIHQQSLEKIRRQVVVKDSRVMGAIGAIELANDASYGGPFSQRLQALCLKNGLFVRPLGNVIYLLPPYGSEPGDLANAWSIISDALKELQ
jgi:adenosylmethionine-8-amino-7-oxononanoate aminotransferase